MSPMTPSKFMMFLLLALGLLLLVNAFSAVLYQSVWIAAASSIVSAWCIHQYVEHMRES